MAGEHPMTDRSIAVSFRQVSRHYGEVRAVDDVSFDIADGEFFSMLGPSGSGKTTCLRLIAGFEQPSAGEVVVHGRNMAGVPPYERDVNTVFQDYALFPHMTVAENVAYGLMIRRVPKPERAGARPKKMLGDGGARRLSPGAAGSSCPAASASASHSPARWSTCPGAAAGRTARRTRPQIARGDAGRAEGAAAPGRHHLRLCHPRPGRGLGDERPGRGVQPRPARADRHARSAIYDRPATAFLPPASSASPTWSDAASPPAG